MLRSPHRFLVLTVLACAVLRAGAENFDLVPLPAYSLSRLVYLCFAPDQPSGEPASPALDPKEQEFLRYILSRQGQADVAQAGDYLPLTVALGREQLLKLDSPNPQASTP